MPFVTVVRGDVPTREGIVHLHGDVEFSLWILSDNLPGALQGGGGVFLDFYFTFFFPPLLGLEESCRCQPGPMVSGIDVPAVAFPVEEMQWAERAGSIRQLRSSNSRAPCPLSRGNCSRALVQAVDVRRQPWLCEAASVSSLAV